MQSKKNKIRIGVDFDGVVAYNPFRVVRAPITGFKRLFFGQRKVKFWVPQAPWQRLLWGALHESSVFPARGVELLRELSKDDRFELHLVTARYSFLHESLRRWLTKYDMHDMFDSIHINERDEQPHLYKHAKLEGLKLDYFIEDNYDIVSYLHGKTKTKVFWIYNITDRGIEYADKFPYLEKALLAIRSTKSR